MDNLILLAFIALVFYAIVPVSWGSGSKGSSSSSSDSSRAYIPTSSDFYYHSSESGHSSCYSSSDSSSSDSSSCDSSSCDGGGCDGGC